MVSDYVLTIKLDDTQLNRQLAKFKQAFAGGGTGYSSGGSTTDQIGKFAKFGVIALGVTEIVKMFRKVASIFIDSSPMLKQMLNLFNNELMLMLMPLGNFIGFVLQPILLVLLRYVILPFYRYFMPLAQRYGLQLGDGIARLIIPMLQFFSDPAGSLVGLADAIGKTISGSISGAGGALSAWINSITSDPTVKQAFDGIGKIFTNLYTEALNWLNQQWSGIGKILTNLYSGSLNWLNQQWSGLTKIFTNLYSGALNWLDGIWSQITTVFTNMGNTAAQWLATSWQSIGSFFSGIASDIASSALSAWKGVVSFLVWMGTSIGNAWNTLAAAVSTISGGLIKLPTWSNGSGTSSASTTTTSNTQGVGGGKPVGGSPITVHVNVQGNVVTNEDLKKTITSTVQQVMVKYKYGKL